MAIADKLQTLVNGKQYVVDKTNAKASSDLQLNCTWEELGDTIENISGGGVDTSDSTASANDIRLGKTAYIGTGKVEGTIADYDGSYEGDGEEAVNTLKKLLDHTQTTANMFYGNSTTSDFNGYIQYNDTENVNDMSYMFHTCIEIETVPLFNTKNVTKINGMFYNCSKLITIPNFDFSKVQTMNTLFSMCNNLKTVSLSNTSSAYNMASVFNNCKSLETITELNTQSAEDMSYMFNNCYELVNLPRLNTKKNTNFKSMFLNCDVLEKIDISYFKCASTNMSDSMFYNCASLKTLIIREFGPYYVINTNTFTNCFHILGKTNETNNPEGLKDGYIYVPRNMIETLSNETNWSAYASQLRALEDYTIDGTITGELDESKVSL